MRNFKIWSGLVLIFVSGAVVGSIVSALLIKQRVEGFPKRGPHMANRMIVYEIIRDMELSPALRDSIDAILEADRLEVEKLGAEFGRSLEEFTGRQFEKIKVVLSDDQKEIFDERAAELRERFERMREKGRPGDHRNGRPGPPPSWEDRGAPHSEPPDSLGGRRPPEI